MMMMMMMMTMMMMMMMMIMMMMIMIMITMMHIQNKKSPLAAVAATRLYWSNEFQDGQSGVDEAAEWAPIKG